MSEIKPDMSSKFAAVVDGTTPNDPPPMHQPVTDEQMQSVMAILDKIAPDTIGEPVNERVVQCINRAFAHAHQMAAGIIPVVDQDNPVEPIGYMHPKFGFFCNQTAMENSVSSAYTGGIKEGRSQVEKETAELHKNRWKTEGKKIFEAFKLVSFYALCFWGITNLMRIAGAYLGG